MTEFEEVIEQSWKYEDKGDCIEGVLLEVKEDMGVNKSMLYVIETAPNNPVSVWGSKVLDQKMRYIKVGEHFKIVYEGKKKGQLKDYHDFRVFRSVLRIDGGKK